MPERQFLLSCESTVDLPYAYVAGRDIPILFYSYMIDGETFLDDMGRDPDSIPAFYRRLDAGPFPPRRSSTRCSTKNSWSRC